mmetsp:Transcript_14558/g.36840  ORF Transcript_14558/g.36840 Transcript_14558/m.36840 type:complete len:90 (-) Transcript_14558:758-1027(-)
MRTTLPSCREVRRIFPPLPSQELASMASANPGMHSGVVKRSLIGNEPRTPWQMGNEKPRLPRRHRQGSCEQIDVLTQEGRGGFSQDSWR